jgi:hypothetical protein
MGKVITKFKQFNDSSKITVSKCVGNDIDELLNISAIHFAHYSGGKENFKANIIKDIHVDVSLVAKKSDKIVGGYFFEKTKLPNITGNFYDFSNSNLMGLRGVALFVHPDHTLSGIGHELKHYYDNNIPNDISFIWGQAYHDLNNVDKWLKSRIMFNDIFDVYHTIQFYKGSISDFRETKFLHFYEENDKHVLDVVADLLRKKMSIPNIINKIETDYIFELTTGEIEKFI